MLKCLNVKIMERGFTLIEMIVAVGVFALIIGSATGLFISAIRSQAKALAAQKLLDETSYIIEYMGRFLRMAVKDENGSCLINSGPGYNYENPDGNPWAIRFINYHGQCQEFFLENGILQEDKNGVILPLTSDDFKVSFLNFNLSGQDEADDLQPRATISLTIGKKPDLKTQITIQTTISQRNLDL